MSILFLVAAGPIVGFINRDPPVQAIAIRSLHIISLGYVFYGAGMVLTNAFNRAGDTLAPLIINIFYFLAFQMPLAWFLAIFERQGPTGVFVSILVAEPTLSMVSFIIVFWWGKWKTRKV